MLSLKQKRNQDTVFQGGVSKQGPLLHRFSHGLLSHPTLRELRRCLADLARKQIWVLSPLRPRAVPPPWPALPRPALRRPGRPRPRPGRERQARRQRLLQKHVPGRSAATAATVPATSAVWSRRYLCTKM